MFYLVAFIAWLIFDLLIVILSSKLIPYVSQFTYLPGTIDSNLPPILIRGMSNFDGVHYISIAKNGYYLWEQAFFPSYSLIIRFFSLTKIPPFYLGLFISIICFIVSVVFIKKYFINFMPKSNLRWAFLFILSFPTSFFFHAVYTESLFLMLVLIYLYYLDNKKNINIYISGFLASLTRLVGIFLIVPLLVSYYNKNKKNLLKFKPFVKLLVGILFSVGGLIAYMIYLARKNGDALLFIHSQTAFHANRSAGIVLFPQTYFRYIKILLTASKNFQYFVSVVEFSVFTFVFICLSIQLW